MSSVALLLLYRVFGPRGPEVFLQLHTNGRTWRFFGGHRKGGETPLDAVVREAHEELNLKLRRPELGEGWNPFQFMCCLRVPLGGIYVFPLEVDKDFPPAGFEIREGLRGEWHPVKALPASISIGDKLLVKSWVLRRFVFNQAYIVTRLQCPIVTVDLEASHHYAGRCGNERSMDRTPALQNVTEEFLAHLERAGAKATFFCVASTAKKYPELIRNIVRNGHEVASHSTNHELACTQTVEEFQYDISISKETLEDIAEQPVVGYRAPGWSWPRDAKQRARFYEALRDAGYLFNSSVIPAAVLGIPGLPTIPYKTDAGVWELPLPAFGVPLVTKNLDRFAKDGRYTPPRHAWAGSICMPYSGGFFLRCLGVGISRLFLSYHLKKKGYGMTYVHPRELSGEDASWITGLDDRYLNIIERWRIAFHTGRLKAHFFSLLSEYSGCSIQQFLAHVHGTRPVSVRGSGEGH